MTNLKCLWVQSSLSASDLDRLRAVYDLDARFSGEDFANCHDNWNRIIQEMTTICFDESFGFLPCSKAAFLTFLTDDTQFYYSLNRQSGQSILYGLDHVTLRRDLFNSMPVALRLAIFKKKVEALELESGFRQFDSDCVLDQLVSVEDIGMGHSVYLCSFTHRDIVVKHRPFDGQCLYMRLMAVMGWQTFDHYFYTNHFGPWEFSESLGTQNCNDYLMSGQSIESILPGLARKAAVGDLFGIGDRHFENYMIHDGHILSVDVSILFWPNNEEWSARYMSAGLYEITALRFFTHQPALFQDYWTQFFEHYRYYIELISGFLKPLSEELSLLCESEEASRCVSFLEERLRDPSSYVLSQQRLYAESFLQCLSRLPYKDSLSRIGLEKLHDHPLYKMYYLSDKGRLSVFLHAEKREQFFDNLKTFCLEHDPDFQSTLVKNETDTSEIKMLLETLLIG